MRQPRNISRNNSFAGPKPGEKKLCVRVRSKKLRHQIKINQIDNRL